jgi:purine-binding chemotaxis protein CheW
MAGPASPQKREEEYMAVAGITDTRQYLTFRLGEESFAVDVAQVREILELIPITRVPKTPEYMRGVINVRGSVVPVVDMRLKFGMPKGEDTINTCVIVLEVDLDGEATVIGALADAVNEVSELAPGQIEPAPRLGVRLNTEFVKGIGKHDEKFIIILDIDRIFSTDELVGITESVPEASNGKEAAPGN